MIKYGPDWWKMVFYWRASQFINYLMEPCLPMKVAIWIDDSILHRWCVLKFYDTWTMRLDIIFYCKWSDLIYGKEKKQGGV